ncbi:hypothetical protein ACDY96_22170 [Rhizobium mongolense]|uniref:hypothetical protein n=1 Tax=Rhizobium TaxID=379 RepID=UPI0024B26B25|nr:hypothetical protein [Rhizobium sp. CC1099]WFU89887.1 hypothetical protein QA644_27975 [Rhizobium sp. CC1099]
MADFGIAGPYVGAMLMSLGALCLFIWGVLSGALSNADRVSQEFFEREMENDRRTDHETGRKP